MANSKITERGLLLYYTSFDEISKIDSTELGELIKKELEWMSGRVDDEPTFDDVRCDIFHMHLKEQITIRDITTKSHKPNDKEKIEKPKQHIINDEDIDIEKRFKINEQYMKK